MKRFLPLALSLACAGLCSGQDTARMDQVIQSYVKSGKFMGSVLVARGDKVLFEKGYGSANLEWAVANGPATKFRLGSITKQFTAASILLLEERGKLSINDPVKKYMPDAPAAWDKVTIFNLLTHTSGIPSFTGFKDYAESEPFATTPAKLVARFKDKPLEFEPGTSWNYSNSGYALLGYLIERVSGTSYADFAQKNLFDRLGMADSGYDSNRDVIMHRASGYTPGEKGPENAGYIDMTVPFSAGALYSTTEDLLKWEKGLYGGKVLSAESLRKMTTPFKNNYAFGIGVSSPGGRKRFAHGGGIEGFNTFILFEPEDQTAVIVLANLNGNTPDEIASHLEKLSHGEKVILNSERKSVPVPRETLQRYVGTYEFSPGFNYLVTLEGDQLMGQLGNQPNIPLFAETPTFFYITVVDAQIEVVTDPKGAVSALILHQNGEDHRMPRKSASVEVHPAHKEITLPTESLKRFEGTYQLGTHMEIVVSLVKDQLGAQLLGQPRFPIFPEAANKFFLRAVDAQIEFQLGPDGAVKSLILHQGGADTLAPRE